MEKETKLLKGVSKCPDCGFFYTEGYPHKCYSKETNMKKVYHSSWTAIEDPIHKITCPHCKSVILMSKRSTIQLLTDWAKRLRNIRQIK